VIYAEKEIKKYKRQSAKDKWQKEHFMIRLLT